MRKLAIITATGFCLLVSMAAAEEVTRESYRAQVEPICHTNTKTIEDILTGVRREVKQGKLRLAGSKFVKVGAVLQKAYLQLAAVPQPPADAARLATWLGFVKKEAELFRRAGMALKANQKKKFLVLEGEITHNANVANVKVLVFNFHYCRIEPSKYV